jgi:hypothetical protein
VAQPPTPVPTIPDANQPLLDLIGSFNACARAIDTLIDRQTDPYSAECQKLRTKEQAIVDAAADLSAVAMAQIAAGIPAAVGELRKQVDVAKSTLAEIQKATQAVGIVTAVLAAAAGIASGGVLAGVPAISTLAGQIAAAVAQTGNDATKA